MFQTIRALYKKIAEKKTFPVLKSPLQFYYCIKTSYSLNKILFNINPYHISRYGQNNYF